MSRRAARQAAVFVLYQWDVTGRPLASLYEGEVDEWAGAGGGGRVAGSGSRCAHHGASHDWPADRLGALERNILRVALVELDRGEAPRRGRDRRGGRAGEALPSEDAGRLVNGILGRIVREAAA